MSESHNPAQQIEALGHRFRDELPARLLEMEKAWQAARRGDAGQFAALQRLAHGLAGSSAIFGYRAVGEAAHALEQFLEDGLTTSGLPEACAPQVENMLAALRQAADHPDAGTAPGMLERVAASADRRGTLVYLVEDDESLAQHTALQLSLLGYEICVIDHPSGLEAALAQRLPAAVVMDIVFDGDDLAGVVAARNLMLTDRGIPVVFLSRRNDFKARLEAVRAGAACYLVKPVEMAVLGDRLDALAFPGEPDPYRVLIVEDRPDQVQYYAAVLQQAGMLVRVAGDPPQAFDILSEFHPELVLMDMYLPVCSGVELARVIRQLEPYFGLPIVFLSVESDLDRQLEAMAVAGDEFLTKPIQSAQLISAVTGRIRRYRAIQALMVHDGLTGLLNHSRLLQQLELEVVRAERQSMPLSFAMIDLDHFKSVNDRYGHPVGDQVLKTLSRLLRQRLRQIDIIGRYGGEEFSVVFPNTQGDQAREVMDRLRQEFSEMLHAGPEEGFALTLSAGIATVADCGTTKKLISAADTALYRAKHEGRNRVVLSSGDEPGKPN